MAWLLHEGKVLATVEFADSLRRRTIGLLGRDGIDGALLLERTRSIHTIGMKFAIDVAFLTDEFEVVSIRTVARHRITGVEWKARHAIEVEAGRFDHWAVKPGDRLEIRGELEDKVH